MLLLRISQMGRSAAAKSNKVDFCDSFFFSIDRFYLPFSKGHRWSVTGFVGG